MKVAIFTLTLNRIGLTRLMVDSLNRNTHIPFDHYILDQGSTDGTTQWLKMISSERIFVFPLSRNIGLNSGDNFILDKIGRDYDVIIKLDNDAFIITDNWLERCLSALGPKLIISPYVLGLLQNRGGVPRYAHNNELGLGFTPTLGGICLIGHNRAWFEDSGGFPTCLPASYHHDDMDFCARLRENRYRFAYKEDVFIRHMDITIQEEAMLK